MGKRSEGDIVIEVWSWMSERSWSSDCEGAKDSGVVGYGRQIYDFEILALDCCGCVGDLRFPSSEPGENCQEV